MDWTTPDIRFRLDSKAAMASTVVEQRFLFAGDRAPAEAQAATGKAPVHVFQDLVFDEGLFLK
jgi:hypothetical protein